MKATVDRLKKFADVLRAAQLAMLVRQGTDCQPNRDNCVVNVIPGAKYTKVNVGGSGKYMVVNDTSEIFGIKAYGVIHRGHAFGTLDTLDDFDWAHYRAQRIRLTPALPAPISTFVERTLTDESKVFDVVLRNPDGSVVCTLHADNEAHAVELHTLIALNVVGIS